MAKLSVMGIHVDFLCHMLLLGCIHIFLFVFTEGPTKEFTLAASTTETLLTDLVPETEYVVTITSYDEVEESVPVIGQLTSKSTYTLEYFHNIIISLPPFYPSSPSQSLSSNSVHDLIVGRPTIKLITSFFDYNCNIDNMYMHFADNFPTSNLISYYISNISAPLTLVISTYKQSIHAF